MKLPCVYCDEQASGGHFKWRGWYRFKCPNGHRFKLASPSKAAANWVKLTTKAQRDWIAGNDHLSHSKWDGV